MKCKLSKCNNEVISAGNRVKEFCSDRCRKAFSRFNSDKIEVSIRTKSNSDKDKIQFGQTALSSIEQGRSFTLPGDSDYRPSCQVVADICDSLNIEHLPVETKSLTKPKHLDYSGLPNGVAIPGKGDTEYFNSNEYNSILNRLMTKTLTALKDMAISIPCWRQAIGERYAH